MRFLILLLLAPLVSVAQTPLEIFTAKMNEPVPCPLPLLWVTWDEEAKPNRDLYESDWKKFYALKERKAQDHQRFVRHVVYPAKVEYDKDGYRVDRNDVDPVSIAPAQWLMSACDDANPFHLSYTRWGRVNSMKAARVAAAALAEMDAASAIFDQPSATQAQRAFRLQMKHAVSDFQALVAGDEVSVDRRRRLLVFVRQYAAPKKP